VVALLRELQVYRSAARRVADRIVHEVRDPSASRRIGANPARSTR
jgi:hypothetical protein